MTGILQKKTCAAGKEIRSEKFVHIDYRELIEKRKITPWRNFRHSLGGAVPPGNAAFGNQIHPWWTLNQTAHSLNLMELVTKTELDNLESFIDNSPISYFVVRYSSFDFLDKPSPEKLEKRLEQYRKALRIILLNEVLTHLNANTPLTTTQPPQTGN